MNNFPVNVNGKEMWISRSVATAVSIYTINDDGKLCILANKRGTGLPGQHFSNPGKWSVITGFIDYDETLEECCIREVHEETGIDISSIKLTMRCIEDDPKRDGQVILIRYSGFIEDASDQELTDKYSEPNEVAELKWIPLNELENYTWTSERHIRKIREYGERECLENEYGLNSNYDVL